MKSKIIKELIGEYFDRVNEKEKNKV